MLKTPLPKLQGTGKAIGRGAGTDPERLYGSAWKWVTLNICLGSMFLWSGNSYRTFPEGPWGQNYFHNYMDNHLPFPLSLSQELPVKFSRGRVMCDLTTDWMQKCTGECSCLLLRQTLKRFAKCKTMLFFLLNMSDLKNRIIFMKNVFVSLYIVILNK